MINKIFSSWKLLVTIIVIVPLIAFTAVKLLEENYGSLPVITSVNNFNNEEYHFFNQKNEIKKFADWDNKILVVDFFFTRCPSICPKMTKSLNKVAGEFKNSSTVHLLSFTVDPEHDSAHKLLKYAEAMDLPQQHWDFLTGDKKIIYKVARKQFLLTATDGDGGPEDFIHSDRVVLVDPKHNIRGYYDGTNNKEIEQLINDIKKLQHEN